MTSMKWEYAVVRPSPRAIDRHEPDRSLSNYGEKRWELVTVLPEGDSVVLYFKRPRHE